MNEFLLAFLIFIAGFIDSLIGGGGLITVPALTLALGPGALPIGTNKILGTAAALTALIIYSRRGHLRVKKGLPFVFGILTGSTLGAMTSPHLPPQLFPILILIMSPFLLGLILRKDFLIKELHQIHEVHFLTPILLGLAAGFYDGVFGPGGGTFMFLALYVFGGLPLMEAIATSKLANTASAGVSLATYSFQGYVNWSLGGKYFLFIVVGAIIGANLKMDLVKKLVRPLLILLVTLLALRVAYSLWS